MSIWRPASEVPKGPLTAIFAEIAEDGEPVLVDGIFEVRDGVWLREHSTERPPHASFWLAEQDLFETIPLKRPRRRAS
ncbi:MAG: hypothetical protein KatS3mg082_1759 [Nitrospiraceae bacterium]|nr:MAG: hypothetical protein KatS3mg082_1759 [Nitrospiraceae bacterium]